MLNNIKFTVNKIIKYIDYTGLCLIGLLSLGFLLYYRSFAKVHIYLSFLQVPFFIGDVVFAVCFLLFCLKWLNNFEKVTRTAMILSAYFIFVTIKLVFGYYFWGALALRHAVMFYYPFFAVFAYSFYTPAFFGSWRRPVIILLLLFIFKFLYYHPYYNLTSFLIAVILINKGKSKKEKFVLFTLLFLLLPYKYIFNTSRSFVAGNLLALTYILTGVLIISGMKKIYKIVIAVLFVLFVIYGLFNLSSRNDLKSLIGFDALSYRFNLWESTIQANKENFVKPTLKVRLYNEKRDTFEQIKAVKSQVLAVSQQKVASDNQIETVRQDEEAKKSEDGLRWSQGSRVDVYVHAGVGGTAQDKHINNKQKFKTSRKHFSKSEVNVPVHADMGLAQNKHIKNTLEFKTSRKDSSESKVNEPVQGDIGADQNRHINVSYANILFRIFIWRDALNDLALKKPLFGFDFGYPLRSSSLEILGWAIREWEADGWICMHNSFIDLIYRGGVVGFAVIVFIIILLVQFTIISLRKHSLTGILLTGIIINWLIAANFLEILEMPYSAIPLWSLFGLNFAYLFKARPQ